MNKKIIMAVMVFVIAGGIFYGGVSYGKRTISPRGQFNSARFSANANSVRGSGIRTGMNDGFTTGEIISKDPTSVTIKMQDGSTKIALIATSTQVVKSLSSTVNDLIVGTNISVVGTSNSDGSLTAQSIQIRSAEVVQFGRTRTNP